MRDCECMTINLFTHLFVRQKELELCRAHTPRAHCAIYRFTVRCTAIILSHFREIEMLLSLLGVPVTLEKALSAPRPSPN